MHRERAVICEEEQISHRERAGGMIAELVQSKSTEQKDISQITSQLQDRAEKEPCEISHRERARCRIAAEKEDISHRERASCEIAQRSHARKLHLQSQEQISQARASSRTISHRDEPVRAGTGAEKESCEKVDALRQSNIAHRACRIAELVVAQTKRISRTEKEPAVGSRRERAMRENCMHDERANLAQRL